MLQLFKDYSILQAWHFPVQGFTGKYIRITGGNMKITDSDIEQPVFTYNFKHNKEEILFLKL